LVEQTARWIARATCAAGHQTVRPLRDTESSRAAARTRAQENVSPNRRGRSVKVAVPRPVALGGHNLRYEVGCWSCTRCKARTKQYSKLAPKICPGSAALRWAEKAQILAAGGSGGSHSRVLSGELMWCTRCGAYANSSAKGLSKPCPGRFQGKVRGGLPGQLKVLQSGRHPTTFMKLPEPIPEPAWLADGVRDGFGGVERETLRFLRTDWVAPQHQMDSAERESALLQRIRAKEAANKGSGIANAGSSSAPKRALVQEPTSGGQLHPDRWTAKRRRGIASEEQLRPDAAESSNEPLGGSGLGGSTRPENRCAGLTGSVAAEARRRSTGKRPPR
jgi:hypothetical protein